MLDAESEGAYAAEPGRAWSVTVSFSAIGDMYVRRGRSCLLAVRLVRILSVLLCARPGPR